MKCSLHLSYWNFSPKKNFYRITLSVFDWEIIKLTWRPPALYGNMTEKKLLNIFTVKEINFVYSNRTFVLLNRGHRYRGK